MALTDCQTGRPINCASRSPRRLLNAPGALQDARAAPLHSHQAAALASTFKLRTKSTIIGLTSSGASSCGQWPTPGRPTTLRTLWKRSSARTRAGGVHGSASALRSRSALLAAGGGADIGNPCRIFVCYITVAVPSTTTPVAALRLPPPAHDVAVRRGRGLPLQRPQPARR